MPDKEIRLSDLVKREFPSSSSIKEGTYLQRAGVSLFWWVLILMGLVIVVDFLYLWRATPGFPPWNPDTPPDSAFLEILVTQREAAFRNFLSVVEKLITPIFLPIITAILGYLFGTRGGERRS